MTVTIPDSAGPVCNLVLVKRIECKCGHSVKPKAPWQIGVLIAIVIPTSVRPGGTNSGVLILLLTYLWKTLLINPAPSPLD